MDEQDPETPEHGEDGCAGRGNVSREKRVRCLKRALGVLTGRCSFDPRQIRTGDNELKVTVTDASGAWSGMR